ncbi:acetyl xylan esterase [Aspergillus affinis]|uniref:acetyl xylan esterase n=1 Tax=Aspergillus affinis TaxID=1070780 RepID=UPI0022FE4CF5|nr:alpha/beta-hydrolase [Aspergillus affinis]KAI9042115.1 alpha/beta-hydrolase [Aspergillus affinis]
MLPLPILLTTLLCAFSSTALTLQHEHAKQLLPRAGSLEQITDFGDNPTNVGMYIYVPNNLSSNPAIIVGIHWCSGTAQAYYTGSPYATYAEQHGFIVIYPDSPYEGGCWDVSSQATLTRDGGGNSNSIANMVKWAVEKYEADEERVFVTGLSSGAMMTNVMAATYPDLFAAGIVYAGVPAGCFLSTADEKNAWNSTCSQGNSITTPEHWAAIAKAMDPGYDGPRPKMQIYHGSQDTTLYPQNYYETCKQWAGVFGYEYDSPEETKKDTPLANWASTVWGEKLTGVLAGGVDHGIQIQGKEDMVWFGFT